MKHEDPKRYRKWNIEDLVMVTTEQHRKLHGKKFREDLRNRTMRAFILCRQSGGANDPEESLSLEVQEAACLKIAEDRGISIAGIFREASTSGRLYPTGFENIAAQDMIYRQWCEETKKNGQYRTEFGKILEHLNDVDYIICYDITRLYRPLNGSYLSNIVNQLLQYNKVKVLTLKEGEIDFSRFQDSLIASLTSQINSEQLLIQREKAKAGMKKVKDAGEYYSGFVKCIGYKTCGRKVIEIVPHEAEAIKQIYNYFLKDGLTLNEIARRIAVKYPDVFKRCWSVTVKNILTNPIYAGYMYNSENELIRCKQNEGKEIISFNEWENAHKILSARKLSAYRHKEGWFPLTPFIWCGHCGEKMRTHLGKNLKPNYSCQRHLKDGGKPCKNTIMAFYDGKEGNGLFEAVKPLLVAEAIDRMKKATDDKLKNRLSVIEMNLNNLITKEKKMTALYMSSAMTDDVYESSMNDLKIKRKELEKEKASLDFELSRDTSQFEWVKFSMKFTGDLLSHAEYDLLISGLIKKILIYKDFIEIKTRLGDVTLPRQRVYRHRLVCSSHVQMKMQKPAVYFYYGKHRPLKSEEKDSAEMIGKIGEVSIYLIK